MLAFLLLSSHEKRKGESGTIPTTPCTQSFNGIFSATQEHPADVAEASPDPELGDPDHAELSPLVLNGDPRVQGALVDEAVHHTLRSCVGQ